jgi:hypothetical protein
MCVKELTMNLNQLKRILPLRTALALGLALCLSAPALQAATPTELRNAYRARAGTPAVAARGEQFFTSSHGREWTCSSCHGAKPTVPGKHASTGKTIAPLAPRVNSEAFTDEARAEKWFRRNCNDVLGRECSAAEKADVLTWLIGL